jgi:hypothetical protein
MINGQSVLEFNRLLHFSASANANGFGHISKTVKIKEPMILQNHSLTLAMFEVTEPRTLHLASESDYRCRIPNADCRSDQALARFVFLNGARA